MEETTLDTQQRKDGRNLLHSVITDTGRYMAAGIQYANRKAGVTDRDFWEGCSYPPGAGNRTLSCGRIGMPTLPNARRIPTASWIYRPATSTCCTADGGR